MIKRFNLVSIVFLLISVYSFSQKSELVLADESISVHRVSDYPEGFYYAYNDFITKNVRPPLKLVKKNLQGYIVLEDDFDDNQFFFYSKTNGDKVTDIFAISHNGNLYIEQKYFTKYAKKGNKNEYGDNPYSYHRVIKDGKFLYLEGSFANAWAKGAAYNLGAAGGAYAATLNKLKGVVFDFNDNKFDFIKNCKDFKLFLKEYNYTENVDCDNFGILQLREIISTIIKE